MRYPASEKLEIIRIVEQSHLPAWRTLEQLGIPRRTFYRWYDRYLEGGPEALEDRPSAPRRVWNRIGDDIQQQIIDMALDTTDLSPRELAVRFTDEKRYFVSEATVYRLLKAHDLITSPAFVVIRAADAFHTKTTRPNEMWQTDFTYFKIIGWGWVYLSTVLDDFSRYIIAWKLCTNMRAEDVTDTLDMALAASGCDQAHVQHRPRLLVLDIMLPKRSGFDVLKQLRSEELTRVLPVLILTAKGQQQDRRIAEELGADGFVTKPYSNAEVVGAVRQLLGDNDRAA